MKGLNLMCHSIYFSLKNLIFCSCYRDSVVNAAAAGSRRYLGGTTSIGNGGHGHLAVAPSVDAEARRFSIDSGDVRADFYRDGLKFGS